MVSQTQQSPAEQMLEKTRHKTGYRGFYQRIIKRVADILICLVALPFVLLVTIPVAILIKLEDNGPAAGNKLIKKEASAMRMLLFYPFMARTSRRMSSSVRR